jgi:hypothetical protein
VRSGLPGLSLLAAVALVSCGDTTIDTGKDETVIRRAVTQQAGARVASVACPEGVKARKDVTFTCVVTGRDGSKGDAVVRVKDDDGTTRFSAPFLHMRDVEAVMADQLRKRTKVRVTIACQEIVVVRKGGRFRCRATSDGRSGVVVVRFVDDAGHFRFRPPELR